MTTTSRPNRDALQSALDVFRDAMRPFIVRCLRRAPGRNVEQAIEHALKDRQRQQFRDNLRARDVVDAIDVGHFPDLIGRWWREVFDREFDGDRTVQNALWQIAKIRNEVAHPSATDVDAEYARSRLYDVADLLGRINRPDEKRAVRNISGSLAAPPAPVTPSPAPPAPAPPSPAPQAVTDRKTRPAADLKPWRDVIRPNGDVALGTFREAEFAADLQQVHDGRAAADYGNPVNFFNRTHITPGIRTLLVNTLRRLAGSGGDPVIQTRTGFGGGKTHSLIALYHLVQAADALTSPNADPEARRTAADVSQIMRDAGVNPGDGLDAQVAVLDGAFLAPTDQFTTEYCEPLNTLWGSMAHQLGGQPAYEIVGQAARQGTAPGGAQLDRLLEHVGPCVILVDELVAYTRNAGDARDNIYTFVQNLTQSVRRSAAAVLVVTLPESSVEAGGEAGAEALTRLDAILGRIEAVWEPLETNEAFEVVRRRLFAGVVDDNEKDRTCEAFSRMYGRQRQEYPQEAGEQRYLRRMKECYPIHPEVFDRLYQDWSSIPSFQRTRGVLRMMANWISRLDLDGDSAPLIMPGSLRLDDPSLAVEFTKHLPGQWDPVLSEVDGPGSRADAIDKANSRFMGAARRSARAVFLGSSTGRALKGIDRKHLRLGVVRPGQGFPIYDEALSNMTGSLYYLYDSDGRYYFHAEENLNKVAADRAGSLGERSVEERIVADLKEAVGRRRSDVIVCPASSEDVPDADFVRLVVLHPGKTLPSRSGETDHAGREARGILKNRGPAPRVRKNTLLFLAAKTDETRALRTAVRTYLAWDSIVNGDRRITNLTGDRLSQARSSLTRAAEKKDAALLGAYRWTMSPSQKDPLQPEYDVTASPTSAIDAGNPADAAFKHLAEREALVNEISPSALADLLRQHVWANPTHQYHVRIDALWDMIAANVYMPRLRDKTVLVTCVMSGTEAGAFGHAAAYDGSSYQELRYREPVAQDTAIGELEGLLVNPEMAELVKAEPQPGETPATDEEGTAAQAAPYDPTPEPSGRTYTHTRGPVRIVASKTSQNDVSLDDVRLLQDEIIRSLSDDGGEITVTITISARKPGGFSENTARSVRENGAQLGLDLQTE